MSEHEARLRAFYDHEVEEPRAGRRRRQVADWGVGEDAFDRLPSRRFSRVESAHARRAAEFAALQSDAAWADAPSAPSRPAAGAEPPSSRRAADAEPSPSRRAADAEPSSSRRAADAEPPAPRPASDAPVRLVRPAGDAPARPPRAEIPRGRVDDGRRTIVIGEPREDYSPAPRRPPRLAHERIGPRPDRIVAYAVGLGVLLILIAILSAGH